jgi:lysylphosphatidylglycerol synthetase-like protein (DUF2156 family)
VLTAVMLAWVVGCLLAGWWQATRAMDGNAMSYLYAIEWPVFALSGIVVWWLLLHTAPATAAEQEERRALEAARRQAAQEAKGTAGEASEPLETTQTDAGPRVREDS